MYKRIYSAAVFFDKKVIFFQKKNRFFRFLYWYYRFFQSIIPQKILFVKNILCLFTINQKRLFKNAEGKNDMFNKNSPHDDWKNFFAFRFCLFRKNQTIFSIGSNEKTKHKPITFRSWKKRKIPPAAIGFYQKNRFSESNPFLLYKKKKPMFPASLNIFHRVRVKENFFSENFFRQRQRTHCFSPIDRKNKFRQTYPERYRRKTLRYYPFCSFRLFSACIISRLFQYAAFACRFFSEIMP